MVGGANGERGCSFPLLGVECRCIIGRGWRQTAATRRRLFQLRSPQRQKYTETRKCGSSPDSSPLSRRRCRHRRRRRSFPFRLISRFFYDCLSLGFLPTAPLTVQEDRSSPRLPPLSRSSTMLHIVPIQSSFRAGALQSFARRVAFLFWPIFGFAESVNRNLAESF